MFPPFLSRLLLVLCSALAMAACSTGSQRGAQTGAVGGLVAGAVGSIFWGGDAVNNALRGAAVGAASGAAVGAMNDRGQDRPEPSPAPVEQRPRELSVDQTQLRSQMGDLNFAAGEELARCRHVSALSRAEQAFSRESDPRRKGYALLIQAMAAEESGNSARADAIYAQWREFDPARTDLAMTRNEALEGLLKVQRIRQDSGLPPLCT